MLGFARVLETSDKMRIADSVGVHLPFIRDYKGLVGIRTGGRRPVTGTQLAYRT